MITEKNPQLFYTIKFSRALLIFLFYSKMQIDCEE